MGIKEFISKNKEGFSKIGREYPDWMNGFTHYLLMFLSVWLIISFILTSFFGMPRHWTDSAVSGSMGICLVYYSVFFVYWLSKRRNKK